MTYINVKSHVMILSWDKQHKYPSSGDTCVMQSVCMFIVIMLKYLLWYSFEIYMERYICEFHVYQRTRELKFNTHSKLKLSEDEWHISRLMVVILSGNPNLCDNHISRFICQYFNKPISKVKEDIVNQVDDNPRFYALSKGIF